MLTVIKNEYSVKTDLTAISFKLYTPESITESFIEMFWSANVLMKISVSENLSKFGL